MHDEKVENKLGKIKSFSCEMCNFKRNTEIETIEPSKIKTENNATKIDDTNKRGHHNTGPKLKCPLEKSQRSISKKNKNI